MSSSSPLAWFQVVKARLEWDTPSNRIVRISVGREGSVQLLGPTRDGMTRRA